VLHNLFSERKIIVVKLGRDKGKLGDMGEVVSANCMLRLPTVTSEKNPTVSVNPSFLFVIIKAMKGTPREA